MKEQEREFMRLELEEARKEAEELDISLQDYLLLRILRELDQLPYRGETEARTETESRKEALIGLLRGYQRELAQAEYTAEVKDPIRMDIMDALWKAENLLTGEEALRKYDTRVKDNPARYHRDGIVKPE